MRRCPCEHPVSRENKAQYYSFVRSFITLARGGGGGDDRSHCRPLAIHGAPLCTKDAQGGNIKRLRPTKDYNIYIQF